MAICVITKPAFANLVQNPGFETGDLTDWTLGGDTTYVSVSTGAPHTGTYSLVMGNISDGTLDQSIATVVGQSYIVDFWLAAGFGADDNLSASFGGTNAISLMNYMGDYMHFTSAPIVATSTSTDLNFTYANPDGQFFLDDISVNGVSGVPETLSTLWLALPFAGMIALRQLRRRIA